MYPGRLCSCNTFWGWRKTSIGADQQAQPHRVTEGSDGPSGTQWVKADDFRTQLREILESLHAQLGGVPFTTVEDAVLRMKSVDRWPMGDEGRILELAQRLGRRAANPATARPGTAYPGAGDSRDLLQLWKDELGFPRGTIEDILNLSDPPFYTACPNPFLAGLVEGLGSDRKPAADYYRRQPFAADVSEGKNDPIYNAHGYHTKVPHRAIMRYILHYTDPGDLVMDGFAGTGMTGVAAQLCGNRDRVAALGYKVTDAGVVLDREGRPFSQLGPRRAVLNDLAPVATFIAYNYNAPVDADRFEAEMNRVLRAVDDACGWLYLTLHEPTGEQAAAVVALLAKAGPAVETAGTGLPWGRVDYTVWSDLFLCPRCQGEVVFWEVALDRATGKVRQGFPCPHCRTPLTKRTMERVWITKFDQAIGQWVRQARQVPVLICYHFGGQRYEKIPDAFDLALIDLAEDQRVAGEFPTDPLEAGEKTRDPFGAGVTHVHHFYTRRALHALATAYAVAHASPRPVFPYVLFTVQQAVLGMAKISRYAPNHFSQVNRYLNGTLYIGSQVVDASLRYILQGKIKRLKKLLQDPGFRGGEVLGETRSLTACDLPPASVAYIFTDPPFGGNLMYSELNFLWEAWLKVFTNSRPEAVTSKARGKGLNEYRELMTRCFREYYRVLKPGRWMTVAFHNSQNEVWNAMQQGLREAGFVIADVQTLDKRQDTFNQAAGGGSVKQDLVISAWKPRGGDQGRSELVAGTIEGVWEFVAAQLRRLPRPEPGGGGCSIVRERQRYLLFDRMVAFHVGRGLTVPLSAPEFYAGLGERFLERDGMYFLADQLPPGNGPSGGAR